jgi:predicted DCC family thiol-disulfide oxidoreductase YuxK
MKNFREGVKPLIAAQPPPKPLMIYDGNCGFCRKWINRCRFLTGNRVDYQPYQKAAGTFPEIPLERFERSVQLVEPNGSVSQGALAVFKTLASRPFLRWIIWTYHHVPGFAFVSESLYSFVAGHRDLFSSADSCGLAPADKPPAYFLSRWFFLKALALVYLAAFGSLWFQITSLVGSQGILPFRSLLPEIQAQWGWKAYWLFPTLCWLNSSDGFLLFLCGAGILISVLLFLDLAPVLCLSFLWLFYLSLVTVGQDFLGFQWDNLLLEAGFLSIFLPPLTLRCGVPRASRGLHEVQASLAGPSRPGPLSSMGLPMDFNATTLKNSGQGSFSKISIFLFQWLLFRLIFFSGIVKWAGGDPAWRGLTALHYHYETQPLPTPPAWFMNQLPDWFQALSCFYMFGVELVMPFFIFGPRRFRPVVFGVLVSLQCLILLTGNYCFFNWLTLALCLFVLEDEAWPKAWREKFFASRGKKASQRDWPGWIRIPVAAVILFMSVFQMHSTLGGRRGWPSPVRAVYDALEPFRSVNSYGLFAVMTTTRPEIIVEGSNDQKEWRVYEFKWKAGDLGTPPHWVAPYQPRLDWQMWFAALGDYRQNPWFVNFLVRLLQGSPEALSLLKNNPFSGTPPRFIRAQLYEYHFTNSTERKQTGNWWKREYKGAYIPPFSLKDISQR